MVFTPHRYPNQVSPNLAWVDDGWNAIQQRLCSESDRAQTPDFNATCWIQGIFYAINNGMIGITLPPQNSKEWNPKSWERLQSNRDLGIPGCGSRKTQHLTGDRATRSVSEERDRNHMERGHSPSWAQEKAGTLVTEETTIKKCQICSILEAI